MKELVLDIYPHAFAKKIKISSINGFAKPFFSIQINGKSFADAATENKAWFNAAKKINEQIKKDLDDRINNT